MNDIIDTNNLPQHIAITMDGNGRWAKEKGKNTFQPNLINWSYR